MEIGKRLKTARNRAGLTRQDVSRITGITAKTIANIEQEYAPVSAERLQTLLELYEVDPNTVFDWDIDASEEDLGEYLDMLRSRPELKVLMSASKKAAKEDIEKAVRIIEALKGDAYREE